MAKRLAVFLNSFLLLQRVFFKKCKNRLFKEKMVLRVVLFYIKLKFRWLQTGLSDWKNTKQLKFCL